MENGIKRLNKICTPYLWINPRICKACRKCVDACPQQVIGILLSRQARILIDILLVVVLIITGVVSKQQGMPVNYWQSAHCLFSLLWFGLVTLHVWQNWKMIKAFTRKPVILKNKITAFVILTYILMFASIISFVIEVDVFLMHFHYITGRLFMLAIVVHVADKFKRFIKLFKDKKTVTPLKEFSYSK